MANTPIICMNCGATGSVGRVTANLQCRCGSTDLDIWDGTQKFAKWGDEHWDEDDNLNLPDHLQHSYDTGYNRGRDGRNNLQGFYGDHQEAANLGHEHGKRDYDHVVKHQPWGPGEIYHPEQKQGSSGGTGWGKPHPDPDANWSDYVGPTPGRNPKIDQKNDADATGVCQICNGTGQDPRASGGGYEENVCRNCHGTGHVSYTTQNDTKSLDAHVPQGPPLGAHAGQKVVVPSSSGNKIVTASQGEKIMAMAATIVENNSGLTTQEAFELARRAVTAFPENAKLTVTIFYDGQHVEWIGGGTQADGYIVATGTNSAHVKWASGPQTDAMTFVDLFDIEPFTASAGPQEDPMHLTAVRRAYDSEREVGVLNFLASNKYLDSWTKIAQDVIAYTEARIKNDSSMELVEEQLSLPERNAVIQASALALLRDAFSDEAE